MPQERPRRSTPAEPGTRAGSASPAHGAGRGTHAVDEARIEKAVRETFSLKPASIIRDLDLLRPIYEKTAAYGHFGRTEPEFTWERTDRAEALRQAAGLKGAA